MSGGSVSFCRRKAGENMKVYLEKDFISPKEKVFIEKIRTGKNEPPHTHEFVEMVYIYEGSAKHLIGDGVYDVSEGDLLFIDVGQTHSFYNIDPKFCLINILLKPDFISGELINSSNIFEVFALSVFDDYDGKVENSVRVVHFAGKKRAEVKKMIDSMIDEFKNKPVGYRSAIAGYMNVLFAYILRSIQQSKQSDELVYIDRLAPEILSYIEQNISEKITLDDLAAKCFYTPSYFCRVFKQCYGTTPKSYIKKMRMEKAVEYLGNTEMSIEQIIKMVGYSERTLFFRHFREMYGKTPSEYRKEV